MAILVTGGAGFIGSHTCVELLNAGYEVVVVDNLYNASEKSLERVKQITGKDLKFYKVDIRDREGLNEVFDKEEVECVIHFAGLKAVGESVAKPLEYYENNIGGTITLCDVMRNHGVKDIIFSSSATVYGDPVSASTLTLTGLDCGSEYRFAVRAVKEGVEGPAAEATAATKKLLKANGFFKTKNRDVTLKLSEVVNFEADTVISAKMYITLGDADITANFDITEHVIDNTFTTFVDSDSEESIGGDSLLMIYDGSDTLSGNCTFRLEFKDSNYYDSVCEWTAPVSSP